MAWKFNSRTPIHKQICDRIRGDIISGKYPPNEQIPSVRQIAFDASVNPNTVQKALSQLEAEGLIYSKGTTGRFVSSDSHILAGSKEDYINKTIQSFLTDLEHCGITRHDLLEYLDRTEKEERTHE